MLQNCERGNQLNSQLKVFSLTLIFYFRYEHRSCEGDNPNGQTCFLDLLSTTVGKYICMNVVIFGICKRLLCFHSFKRQKLRGVCVCVCHYVSSPMGCENIEICLNATYIIIFVDCGNNRIFTMCIVVDGYVIEIVSFYLICYIMFYASLFKFAIHFLNCAVLKLSTFLKINLIELEWFVERHFDTLILKLFGIFMGMV